jgi:putative transcriptional regulator
MIIQVIFGVKIVQNGDVALAGGSAQTTKGLLLAAAPLLDEPTFHRTVIYMLDHNEDGALGLVINRPTDEDHLPGLDPWMFELSEPQVVFAGGPVQSNTLIGVATLAVSASPADGFVSLDNGLGTVDLSQMPGEIIEGLHGLRLFRGYAGWGPGQLDDELEEGAWLVLPADPADVFSAHPQGLWRNVLRRSGGRTSLLADAPDDLSWN